MTSLPTPHLPWRMRHPSVTWSRPSAFHLVIIILLCLVHVAVSCPQDCACYHVDGGQKVSCRYQNLNQVPKDVPSDTVELDMGHCYMPKLDVNTFPTLSLLRGLILDWCEIERVEEGAFTSLSNVQYIKLSNNLITEVHPQAFQGLRRLKRLHLDNNQLKNLSHSLFRELVLEELLLHSNGIQTLDDKAFHGSSIRNLNLDENNISNISREMFTPLKESLKNFNLSHNSQPLKLESTIFSGFNFSDLKISYDGLKDPSFLKHIKAHSLDISGHQFVDMDFSEYYNFRGIEEFYLRNLDLETLDENIVINMVSVTLLDLSYNLLADIDGDVFRHTPWLRVLRLDGNLFISLPEALGVHLHNLEVLKVPVNKLAMVRPDAFQGMDQLHELDMRHNHIQVIEESMEPTLSRVQVVHLAGNPLHCNCEMRWYRRWLNESRKDTGATDCSTPVAVSMFSMDPSEFRCRAPTVAYVTENMNTKEGDSVFLTCNAKGDPAPELRWSSPFGEEVSVTPPFNRTRYLTLAIWHVSRIKTYQGGWFTCTATNRKGTNQKSMYIHVYGPEGSTVDVDALIPPTTAPPPTTTTTSTTSTSTSTTTTTTPTPITTTPSTTANTSTAATQSPSPSTTTTTTTTSTTTTTTMPTTTTTTSTTPTPTMTITTTSPYVSDDNERDYLTMVPAWVVGVVVGCTLGAILVAVFVGVVIYKAVQKKYAGRYSLNTNPMQEIRSPMVGNNNQNMNHNHVLKV